MPNPPKSIQQVLQELWELLKDYARQETLGPLRNLGWQLKWGIPGALAFALGIFLLAMGILRGLEHWDWIESHNYLPYLAVVLFLGLVLGVLAKLVKGPARKGPGARQEPGGASRPANEEVRP